jgi:predicted RND superfamily exporter protein
LLALRLRIKQKPMGIYKYRKSIVITTLVISALSLFFATKVNFVFDIERFFPQGDEDLAFFLEFREEFEDDDNFLLVAFTDSTSIFKTDLLQKIDQFTRSSSKIENVQHSNSLTNFSYFVKLQFGGFSPPFPAIHIDDAERLAKDSARVMLDERILGNFISKDAKATVVVLKTENALTPEQSNALMAELNLILQDLDMSNYHILGRAYLQTALVKQQIKEFIFSTLISALLVSLVFWFILRKPIGVFISILSMLACLVIFVGIIGLFQIELDLLSSLFPIIMIIVGVSDVVHVMNKYIDEFSKSGDKKDALQTTIKEIGLATFLTSFTTAIGFLSLMTSRIYPIKLFGMTAALGVIIAFLVVITFTTSLLAIFPPEKIVFNQSTNTKWKSFLTKIFLFTKNKQKAISIGAVIYFVVCLIGMSQISTDLRIYDTLPQGLKVTNDFKFFEEKFAGFRPFELAVSVKAPYKVGDWEVLQEINKVENYLKTKEEIEGVSSITAVYKTMNRAFNADRIAFYKFPENEGQYLQMKKFVDKIPNKQLNVLVNKDLSKARISAKIKDVGSAKIKGITDDVFDYINNEINHEIIDLRITGSGVIFDKNNEYIRRSLLSGLGLAFLAISVIMSLLFKNVKMVIISLVPNIFPLLFGAALMGFLGIALDAPTAIIFAIAFGIAVDDTIHFLSKYKLERLKNKNMEDALEATFTETGKAIIITSIILFFGFLILLFSKTPGIVFVGILVSGTLFSAVIADLLLIPLLIRYFLKE